MAIIETKYSTGDTVFHASVATERKQHPCPDCGGTRRWKALSPAGGQYEFTCPRCSASYRANDDLSLEYSSTVPRTQRLTIGSVRYNSAGGSYDEGASYMCLETGVGSGSIYDEKDLFATEDEALVAAKAKADVANVTTPWIVKQYNKSLSISDYELESATLKKASEAKSRANSMLWNLTDLFAKIEECEGKDEILEAVDDYKRFDWESDKTRVSKVAA